MPFITHEDYANFTKKEIELFIKELIEYFNSVWYPDYRIPDSITTLDEIHEEYLLDYPSTGGYHIIDDSFTGPDCPIHLLSSTSKSLVGYFYGIHLTDEESYKKELVSKLPDEIWNIIWSIKHTLEMKDVKLELLQYLTSRHGCGGYCPRSNCSWCNDGYRVWKPCSNNVDGWHRNKCILVQHKNTIICRKKIELPWEYISDCEECMNNHYFCSLKCENLYDYRYDNNLDYFLKA
jgi:hypothetical protein